jgi:phage baseplate assembly protein W
MAQSAQSPVYSDIDLNFFANPITGDVGRLIGNKAVIQSIKNLVLLNFYEDYFHPEVGTSVKKMLFQPGNSLTATYLSRAISDVIKNYEKRVDPSTLKVTVVWLPSNKAYQVTTTFFIVNLASPISASFLLRRVR